MATEAFVATLKDYVLGHYKDLHIGSSRHVIHQICKGLDVFHKKGICHRALKPSTVFITHSECSGRPNVRIGVSGFARRCDDEKVHVPLFVSLVGIDKKWIAPELDRTATTFTVQMDLYALGLVITYYLTRGLKIKKCPTLTAEHLTEVDSLEQANQGIALITSLLNVNPILRPNTFQVLEHDFFKQPRTTGI
jgi:serine/threonine protein kinase